MYTILAGLLALIPFLPAAENGRVPGPVYNPKGELVRPADYREWIYLTSGMGMTYGPSGPSEGQDPAFDNVFVKPGGVPRVHENGHMARWNHLHSRDPPGGFKRVDQSWRENTVLDRRDRGRS